MTRTRLRALLTAVLALTACAPAQPVGIVLSGPLQELAALTVAPEDTGAHYQRADWGGWTTVAGCDTRETILGRDGVGDIHGPDCAPVCPPATEVACWTSPYDLVPVRSPVLLDIDHIVPLAEAAQSGTRGWSRAQRVQFANDPANLVAVTIHANRSKGDQDPGTWLPASWRCEYAARYVAVKTTYRLTVDQRERDALDRVLAGCAAP
jgi:hypothetical protein